MLLPVCNSAVSERPLKDEDVCETAVSGSIGPGLSKMQDGSGVDVSAQFEFGLPSAGVCCRWKLLMHCLATA